MGTISEKLTYLEETKELIKQAIVDKGVEVNDTDTFRSYADKISEIEGGGGGETVTFAPTTLTFQDNTDLVDIDLSSIDGSRLTSGASMFNYCKNLERVVLPELPNITTMLSMFGNCNKLVSITNLDKIDFNKVKILSGTFNECYALENLDVSGWDTSNVTNMNNTFRRCESVSELDVSGWNTSKVTNMKGMFQTCKKITTLDVSNFNTSKSTDMSEMFSNCTKLETLNGIENFNVSAITATYYGINGMFYGCSSLTSLDLSGWDVSNLYNIYYLFRDCNSLTTLDVSTWKPNKAKSLEFMFANCESLKNLDVSGWSTSNVTTMSSCFKNCSSLTSLDLSGWSTSNVTSMYEMFSNCSSLTSLDLSNFNTSKVTNMGDMFYGCSSLEKLILSSNFKILHNANTFMNNEPLRDLYYPDFGNFTSMTLFILDKCANLGVNSETCPTARQHLTYTFITNSCDRTAQGLGTLQIRFKAETLALFTEDEIAQATSKGYTLIV